MHIGPEGLSEASCVFQGRSIKSSGYFEPCFDSEIVYRHVIESVHMRRFTRLRTLSRTSQFPRYTEFTTFFE